MCETRFCSAQSNTCDMSVFLHQFGLSMAQQSERPDGARPFSKRPRTSTRAELQDAGWHPWVKEVCSSVHSAWEGRGLFMSTPDHSNTSKHICNTSTSTQFTTTIGTSNIFCLAHRHLQHVINQPRITDLRTTVGHDHNEHQKLLTQDPCCCAWLVWTSRVLQVCEKIAHAIASMINGCARGRLTCY